MSREKSIFDDIKFIGESTDFCTKKNDRKIISESGIIKDCSCFVTEEMIAECSNDQTLIEQQALLEGAKFTMWVDNFLKEGKDYKGLKSELRKVMDANDMSNERLKTGRKGFMHACKRILQILMDIGLTSFTGVAGVYTLGTILIPPLFIGGIISIILTIVINRLLRFAVDSVEFNSIKEDSEDIVDQLRTNAKNTKDKKLAKKYSDSADRLEEAIKKHSK